MINTKKCIDKMATRKPLIVNPDASQIQELPNGDSLDGITNVTATGEITAAQPSCLLTHPKTYSAGSGNNGKPISFTNITTNVNCTTSRATNATNSTSGISSITVPSAGTYLVSACISGVSASGTSSGNTATYANANQDQVRLALSKTGISTFPNIQTYPTFIFGNYEDEEFNCTFTLPLTLSANDTLSVHLSHIDTSNASITEGYFSVTKLH